MGLIYKGYKLDEMVSITRNIKEKQVGGQWLVDLTSVQSANAYFQSIGMAEFGTLIRLAYDKYFCENIATNAIKLNAQGEIVGNDNVTNSIGALGDLMNFSNKAVSLQGVAFSLPVIGELLAGLQIISTVIGVFTSEARTRSFNMKNTLGTKANAMNYTQYQGVIRDVRRVARISMLELSFIRPKCATGSPACSLEHLRFDLRGQLQIAGSEKIVELVEQYFNETNFKTFIDSWQLIKAQIQTVQGQGTNYTNQNGDLKTSGCLPTLIFGILFPLALIVSTTILLLG